MIGQFLPLATQIGAYIKMGMDHYASLRMAGQVGESGPELVSIFLEDKMDGWNPMVNGKAILDAETKKAGARFLAGVAINLTGA